MDRCEQGNRKEVAAKFFDMQVFYPSDIQVEVGKLNAYKSYSYLLDNDVTL